MGVAVRAGYSIGTNGQAQRAKKTVAHCRMAGDVQYEFNATTYRSIK
jgi:hypothetical protein